MKWLTVFGCLFFTMAAILFYGPEETTGVRQILIALKLARLLHHLKPRKNYAVPIPIPIPIPYRQANTPVILKSQDHMPTISSEPIYEGSKLHGGLHGHGISHGGPHGHVAPVKRINRPFQEDPYGIPEPEYDIFWA